MVFKGFIVDSDKINKNAKEQKKPDLNQPILDVFYTCSKSTIKQGNEELNLRINYSQAFLIQ